MKAGRPKRRRAILTDEAGAGSVVSFMVAVSVFMVAFSVMTIFVSNYVAKDTAQDNSEVTALATDALSLIATDAGLPPDWCGTTPERLGLLKQGRETTLDMCKLLELRESTGGIPYTDAKAAVGIAPHDFHLRGYPAYIVEKDGTTDDLDGYRVAYVGDHSSGVETAASQVESGILGDLGATYDNRSAGDATGPLEAGDKYEDTARYLAAHLTTRLANLTYNDDEISVEDTLAPDEDSHWQVVNHSRLTHDLDATHPHVLTASRYDVTNGWDYSNGADDRIIAARVNLSDYADGRVWLNFTHYSDGVTVDPGLGLPLDPADYGKVEVRGVTDPTWTTVATELLGNGTNATFEGAAYRLDDWAGDDILISFVWHTETTAEKGDGWFIGNFTVEATTGQGPSTRLADNDLDASDAPYDAVVVGSAVDQAALTGEASEAVTSALERWITGGGDVLALGSEDMDSGWLSNFITGAPSSSNGPLLLGQSDPTHAILNSPHQLDYFDWATSEKTYGVTANDNVFTQVLLRRGASGSDPKTILAASNPNTGYEGTIVLSSYTPHALDADARQKLMENSLLYARFNALYLDYGPTLPPGATLGSANHAGLVDTSSLGLGVIDYRLVLYVWE